jgi:peptidoglycan/LPS O-acetylase OafA/YrhL
LILAGSMVGKHRFIRFFIAGEIWAPWAKLTFTAYIIHPLIYFKYYGDQRIAFPFQPTYLHWIYMAVLVITYIMSIPVSLLCEAPFLHLEKFFIFKEREQPQSKTSENLMSNEESKESEEREDYKNSKEKRESHRIN